MAGLVSGIGRATGGGTGSRILTPRRFSGLLVRPDTGKYEFLQILSPGPRIAFLNFRRQQYLGWYGRSALDRFSLDGKRDWRRPRSS
ncbi:MAG: hypothetical protein EBY17_08655 [Acidobacteriia bacterium]|nr:hypothetical protein [Terriglobia bacterium]